MKKGKPPRRRCPHLRLTVVRRAAAVSCWGQSWRDRSSGERLGRWVGSGSSEPGHRWACTCWEQVARRVAERRAEDRSRGAWKGHGAAGHSQGKGPPDQAVSLWLKHSGNEASDSWHWAPKPAHLWSLWGHWEGLRLNSDQGPQASRLQA